MEQIESVEIHEVDGQLDKGESDLQYLNDNDLEEISGGFSTDVMALAAK